MYESDDYTTEATRAYAVRLPVSEADQFERRFRAALSSRAQMIRQDVMHATRLWALRDAIERCTDAEKLGQLVQEVRSVADTVTKGLDEQWTRRRLALQVPIPATRLPLILADAQKREARGEPLGPQHLLARAIR